MIECYEGRLGGGKTISAVLRMLDAWCAGATVFSNVAIKWEEVKKYVRQHWRMELDDRQFQFLDDEKIHNFHRFTPSNSLVVIDEAHLWFNARDWSQTANTQRELLNFLTQSRKYKTDIIFITQAAANLDKQFMRLIQFVWRFRDMEKFRIPGLGIKWPFKQIMQIQLDYDGKTVLQRKFWTKSKRIFALYDTNAIYQTTFPRLDYVRGTPVKIKRKVSKMYIVVMVLCLLGAVVGGCRVFSSWGKGNPFQTISGTVGNTNMAVQAVASAPTVKPIWQLWEDGTLHREETFQYLSKDSRGFVVASDVCEYVLGGVSKWGTVVGLSEKVAAVRYHNGAVRYVDFIKSKS